MSSSVKTRKTISIWTALLFLTTGISGVILLIAHPGHGSRPSDVFIIWKHVHELAAIPFLVIAVLHIYFNGRTLIRYFGKE